MPVVGVLLVMVAVSSTVVGLPVYVLLSAWSGRARRQALRRSRTARS